MIQVHADIGLDRFMAIQYVKRVTERYAVYVMTGIRSVHI